MGNTAALPHSCIHGNFARADICPAVADAPSACGCLQKPGWSQADLLTAALLYVTASHFLNLPRLNLLGRHGDAS